MDVVTFRALDGSTMDGEVWSAGPRPRSVWVLSEDGPHAVHMDKQREFTPPVDPRDQPHPVWCKRNPSCGCWDAARARYLQRFRYGPPPLRVTEWARAIDLFRITEKGKP